MTAYQGLRRSAPRLELRGARPTSYARLATADAVAGLGFISVLSGLLGIADDVADASVLLAVGIAASVGGVAAHRSFDRRHRPSPGRVLSGLALSWVVVVVLGSGVYLATGTIDRVDDAVVEAAAGFSTTSLTTLDPDGLSVPMQLWRAATQWLGGLIGVIVGVVSMPLALRGGALSREGSHALEQLAPTPVIGRRRVAGIYLALTTIVGLGYLATGLGARDSLVHAFTTASTGGYSSHADSFVGFGTGARVVAIIGMIAGGSSFVIIWWAIRGRTRSIWRSTELRLYLALVAAGTVVVSLGSETIGVTDAIFTAASAASTTGYAVTEWTAFDDSALMVLLLIIGTGAMAGSAGGGLRVIRAWSLVGFAGRELRRQLDPHAVVVIKQAGEPIDEAALEQTTGYQIAHIGVCLSAAFLLAVSGLDVVAAIFTGISVISTHGPGVGAGAFGSLDSFSPLARIALLPFMLAGRLSILPLLLAVSFAFRIENEAVRRGRRAIAKVFGR